MLSRTPISFASRWRTPRSSVRRPTTRVMNTSHIQSGWPRKSNERASIRVLSGWRGTRSWKPREKSGPRVEFARCGPTSRWEYRQRGPARETRDGNQAPVFQGLIFESDEESDLRAGMSQGLWSQLAERGSEKFASSLPRTGMSKRELGAWRRPGGDH